MMYARSEDVPKSRATDNIDPSRGAHLILREAGAKTSECDAARYLKRAATAQRARYLARVSNKSALISVCRQVHALSTGRGPTSAPSPRAGLAGPRPGVASASVSYGQSITSQSKGSAARQPQAARGSFCLRQGRWRGQFASQAVWTSEKRQRTGLVRPVLAGDRYDLRVLPCVHQRADEPRRLPLRRLSSGSRPASGPRRALDGRWESCVRDEQPVGRMTADVVERPGKRERVGQLAERDPACCRRVRRDADLAADGITLDQGDNMPVGRTGRRLARDRLRSRGPRPREGRLGPRGTDRGGHGEWQRWWSAAISDEGCMRRRRREPSAGEAISQAVSGRPNAAAPDKRQRACGWERAKGESINARGV
jgi:hypothetical protein